MGLISDIQEIQQLWGSVTWPTRILLIVAAVLATGSIASLADVVFAWKGFLRDGLDAYEQFVREPLSALISWLSFDVPKYLIDQGIVMGLALAGMVRVYPRNSELDPKPIRLILKASSVLLAAIMLGLALAGVLAIHHLMGIEHDPGTSSVVGLTLIPSIIAIQIIQARQSNLTRQEKVLLTGPLIFGVVAVLLLGAVNAGLSKSL